MIVFPEYGLTGNLIPETRQTAALYGERMPEPETTESCMPCDSVMVGSEITQAIVCAARDAQMYVVANLIEKVSTMTQKTSPDSGERQLLSAGAMSHVGLQEELDLRALPACNNAPESEDYSLYNTNIIINSTGCIVAKYHKHSLFSHESMIFNSSDVEYAYVDTPFGRIGTLICFDLAFSEPGVNLVEKFNVDTIVFPTYWTMMNTSMQFYMNIVAYSSGWARRMGVNFLAANIRSLNSNSYGSAISTPHGIPAEYYEPNQSKVGKLLIVDLKVAPQRYNNSAAKFKASLSQRKDTVKTEVLYLFGHKLSDFDYNVVTLKPNANFASVCHGTICCSVYYDFVSLHPNRQHVLAAYNSRNSSTHNAPIKFDVCLFQTCKDNSTDSCFQYPISDSDAKFDQFSLTGQFDSDYVFPSLTGANYGFNTVDWHFQRKGRTNEIIMDNGLPTKLLNAAMISPFE